MIINLGLFCIIFFNRLLLEYINNNWTKLSSQFNKKFLRENERSFSVTNDELVVPGKANRDGLSLCRAATKVSNLNNLSFVFYLLIYII